MSAFTLHPGPFSDPFDGEARLVAVDDRRGSRGPATRPGSILLLHGAIAAEQLTPRHYPFYQMDGHARILAALDRAQPAAVIAATGRTPMAAGLYPFPLFEDGDLGHPSAFLRDVEGARLLPLSGQRARLHIESKQRRVPAEQIIASSPAPTRPAAEWS